MVNDLGNTRNTTAVACFKLPLQFMHWTAEEYYSSEYTVIGVRFETGTS